MPQRIYACWWSCKSNYFFSEYWNPDLGTAPTDNNKNPLTFLNVGTGKEISIKELSNKISLEVGFKGKIIWDQSKPDGTPRKLLNTNAIKKLGWKPLIELDEGIKRLLMNLRN